MSKKNPGVELTEGELTSLLGRSKCCELKKSTIEEARIELLMIEEAYEHCILYVVARHGLDMKNKYILEGTRLIEDEQEKVTKIPVD